MKFDRAFIFPAVLLLFHFLFFLSATIRTPVSLSDSQEYLNASQNMYRHGILYCGELDETLREEQYTRRPPLYPLLLGISVWTGSELPMFLFQIALSICSVLLVVKIFQLEGWGRLLVLAFLLLTPAQFIYANRIMAEIPFQLLLMLAAWAVFRYFKDKEVRFIWLFYLCITLGMATKPVLFPFAILTIIIGIIYFIRSRQRAFLWGLLVPLIWILGYGAWNMKRVGTVQYSSVQTANMINYNLRYFVMNQKGEKEASDMVDEIYDVCNTEATYAEKNQCLEKEARKIIKQNPFKYGLFHLKGSIRFFVDPGRFDLATFFNLQNNDSPGFLKKLNQEESRGAITYLKDQGLGLFILLGFIFLAKVAKLAGFLIYIFRSEAYLPLRIFLLVLIAYMAIVTGPLGASRFLIPVELLVIGAAVQGWLHLLKIKNPVKLGEVR